MIFVYLFLRKWLDPFVPPKIFKDGSSYHGWMKALCSKLMPTYYSMELQPEVTFLLNQEHYYEIVGDNVKLLLHKSFFLQGGKDENVVHDIFMSFPKLMCSSGKNA